MENALILSDIGASVSVYFDQFTCSILFKCDDFFNLSVCSFRSSDHFENSLFHFLRAGVCLAGFGVCDQEKDVWVHVFVQHNFTFAVVPVPLVELLCRQVS